MKSKTNLIKLLSILIFIFSLFIQIYDMISHDRLRMLCRSIGNSYTLALSWIFIVMVIILIVSQNEGFNYKILSIIFILYILLTISATMDYKNRLEKVNNWKKLHYILSVSMLLSLLYGVYTIKSNYFPFTLFLFVIFIYCHLSKDYIIRDKISIIFELLIIYSSILILLISTNYNLSINCV